jgi:hypothetical protein
MEAHPSREAAPLAPRVSPVTTVLESSSKTRIRPHFQILSDRSDSRLLPDLADPTRGRLLFDESDEV